MCRDLSEIASLRQGDNAQSGCRRRVKPGSYTFLLLATKELRRKRLQHLSATASAWCVPDHPITLAILLEELRAAAVEHVTVAGRGLSA